MGFGGIFPAMWCPVRRDLASSHREEVGEGASSVASPHASDAAQLFRVLLLLIACVVLGERRLGTQ